MRHLPYLMGETEICSRQVIPRLAVPAIRRGPKVSEEHRIRFEGHLFNRAHVC